MPKVGHVGNMCPGDGAQPLLSIRRGDQVEDDVDTRAKAGRQAGRTDEVSLKRRRPQGRPARMASNAELGQHAGWVRTSLTPEVGQRVDQPIGIWR